ncbi:glycosyltransferase [Saccharophagus degradans]|uniref:Glycosyltransferase n=1 Tax=Saccharophagus degradans TaxID=86304 RepID=A0AAW7X0R3_9GAMM|nr:glycosyltransferase [Saccharophagus degradans]MDO6421060.1 glycosyltransferase [Saccharophagus degradans]MDO6606029.1 glycosyltransferase [Saccharophagus degradans]
MKLKKTCIVMLSFGFGGAESRLLKVAEEVLGCSGGVVAVNSTIIQFAQGRADLIGVLAKLRSRNALVELGEAPSVFRHIKALNYVWVLLAASVFLLRSKPKVVHAVLGGILLVPVAKMIGAKTIVELTSPDNVKFVHKFRLWIVSSTDLFLCVSESVKCRATALLASGSNYRVYPIPYYNNSHLDKKNSIPKSKGGVVVAFCARLIPRKNGLLFAQVAKELLALRADVFVNVIGGGEQEEVIKGLLAPWLGVRANVGRVSNPSSYLVQSDVFVSLIEPDNYPSQSVLEAMDCGNALLLSDTGDSARFLLQDNGRIVELNCDALVSALIDMVDNPVKVKSMGERSKSVVSTHFERSKFIRFLSESYSLISSYD